MNPTIKSDALLRQERLCFYREDVEEIDRALEEFLALSSAKCVLLVDRDGHLITRKGEFPEVNPDSIAALVAGSFAATREMARMLGEPQFRALHHQGARNEHIQVMLVGERTLFVVLFDDRTTLGMIRFYCQEAGGRLEEIFAKAKERKNPEEEVRLSETFGSAAKESLGEILGND